MQNPCAFRHCVWSPIKYKQIPTHKINSLMWKMLKTMLLTAPRYFKAVPLGRGTSHRSWFTLNPKDNILDSTPSTTLGNGIFSSAVTWREAHQLLSRQHHLLYCLALLWRSLLSSAWYCSPYEIWQDHSLRQCSYRPVLHY